MKTIQLYFREIKYLRHFLLLLSGVIFLSYSVYLVFNDDMVSEFGHEDHLFEWLTAISFLMASIIFIVTFKRTGNLFFLLFALMFFFGFGEEISWGQRILNFKTPETIEKLNVQNEVTIHNLELFNTHDDSGNMKHGLSRLLEINLLFKLFTLAFGIMLPLLAFHGRFMSELIRKLRIPVPPVSIGIFFMINWIVFRTLLVYLLPAGKMFQYYDTDTEIYEFVSAFILLVTGLYFYYAKETITGTDIKKALLSDDALTPMKENQAKSELITKIPSFRWSGSFALLKRSKIPSESREEVRY